jgi:hypothetical protein
VSNCPWVGEDLIVVSTLYHTARLDRHEHIRRGLCLEGLISEEVDLFKAFVFDMSERIGLVPTIWKDVERDLTADGIRQAIVCKLLLQDLDKGCSHTMDLNDFQLE